MKVRDLSYVEDELIAGIEQYLPELSRFCNELEEKAIGLAAAQAAKEEAQKTGSVGLAEVKKKPSTRPISPNITKPRFHAMPEPEKISMKVEPQEVPEYLNRTSLEQIRQKRQKELDEARQKTIAKFGEEHHFKLNETKGGKTMDELRREVEEERTKDFAFDASFVNPVPDYSKIPAKVRVNVSTILREDYVYRQQQAKDAQLLKNYEEELRDPIEYYAWQQEMKKRDEHEKLEQVVLRREQAKQSAEDAKEAMVKQREDNKAVADLLREQADAIARRKQLESEIAILENQQIVQAVNEENERKLKEAREKLALERAVQGRRAREELEQARLAKEEEDRMEEERRADKIRQLRALNTVHKKHIVVFDPTQVAGVGVLDEMSFMEMKERLETERRRAEEHEEFKRKEILEAKNKRAKDLEERSLSVMRARQVKADATRQQLQRKKDQEQEEAEVKEKIRAAAAVKLEKELAVNREYKRAEAAALKAEEERIRRQQQYLGAAAGLVEETRAEQQLMGLERETKASQVRAKEAVAGVEISIKSDKVNRETLKRHQSRDHAAELKAKELHAMEEKADRMEKIKLDFLRKKGMVKDGRVQHDKTRTVLVEHNPYSASISAEIHEKTLKSRSIPKASGFLAPIR